MKAKAPGKLILSGEHSVVYGAPALAIAVAQTVTVSFMETDSQSLQFVIPSFSDAELPLAELPALQASLDAGYQRFLEGQLPIGELLSSATDLLFYTLAQAGFHRGGVITITSDIPVGAGMGSSAAVIAALLQLASKVMGIVLSQQQLFEQVRFCERLQHGRGSAIDAAAVTFGGCVRVEGSSVRPLPISLSKHWYIWHSGSAHNSTGETVSAVRERFAESEIWAEFAKVTQTLEAALTQTDQAAIQKQIQANQRLLEQIGIVPAAVSRVIRQIEQLGGAAKVCGAGTLTGDTGGLVLVYLPDDNYAALEKLGLDITPLQQASEGATYAAD